jgi:hypothetical protein
VSAELMRVWLFGWLFWLGISLGSLWMLIIYHLTLGNWGKDFIPRAGAAVRAMVCLVPLGIPLLLGLPVLYPWAEPARVAADPILQHRQAFFNVPFVQIRWCLLMLLWIWPAFGLSRFNRDRSLLRKQGLAAGSMVLQLMLSSVLSVDWVMSLEPHFYSTIFAVLLIMAEVLAATSLLVFLCLRQPEYRARVPAEEDLQRSHDWGSLMLAIVMLLAYMFFSQLVIVWAGNLPHEIEWLLPRVWGSWMPLGAGLFLMYLAGPFLFLITGPLKRNPRTMRPMAVYMAVLSPFMLYYMLWPSMGPKHLFFDPLALLALVLIGLVWGLTYAFFARRTLGPEVTP